MMSSRVGKRPLYIKLITHLICYVFCNFNKMIRIEESRDHVLLASLNEEVQNLHHSMHPEIFKPFDKAATREAVKVFIATDNCRAYIAWKGAEPVGYIILFLRETGENAFHYNIRSVYIDQIGVPEK